jgi:RHS repeat-associated protein
LVVALSDENGAIVERYEYDVYGNTSVCNGSGTPRVNNVSNYSNPYMFTGRRFDDETQLYYYRARMYHPYIGRFMQPDPIGYDDGLNMYAYVTNNPINLLDPFGLDKEGPLPEDCTEILAKGREYWRPWHHWSGGLHDYGHNQGGLFRVSGRGILNANEFGNYAGGYFSYYHWRGPGYFGMRFGGHLIAFLEAGCTFGKTGHWFDDPESIRFLRYGREDAIKQLQKERQERRKLKRLPVIPSEPNKTIIR